MFYDFSSDLLILLVSGNSLVLTLAGASWHSQVKIADSKNNQLLLAIIIGAVIGCIAPFVLNNMNRQYLWMGYMILLFLQLIVLSMIIARASFIAADPNTESRIGTLQTQQTVNTIMLIVGIIVVIFTIAMLYHVQKKIKVLLMQGKSQAVVNTRNPFLSTVQQYLKDTPMPGSLRERASLVVNQKHQHLLGLLNRIESLMTRLVESRVFPKETSPFDDLNMREKIALKDDIEELRGMLADSFDVFDETTIERAHDVLKVWNKMESYISNSIRDNRVLMGSIRLEPPSMIHQSFQMPS